MAVPIWLTPPGNLGIIPELEYYQLALDAYNAAGGDLTYKVISGQLPVGLRVEQTGTISGIPVNGEVVGTPAAVTKTVTSKFSIRVTNAQGKISDRTFELTVAGVVPPVIKPEPGSLGRYFDGSYVSLQLTAIEANYLLTPVFSLLTGELPPGLTLTSRGLISGYITPIPNTQIGGTPNFDQSPYDIYSFDFSGINTSKNYQFTVEVSDGVSVDTNVFTIYVDTRSTLTDDSTTITVDIDTITVDTVPTYSPILYTPAGNIGIIQQNTRFVYQFIAVDYGGATITYSYSGTLPTGLSLNTATGWITGLVPYGKLGTTTYSFSVTATNSSGLTSETKAYTIKVLGQVDSTVVWDSSANLGVIYNGQVSNLSISAMAVSGRQLRYRLITAGALPVGLALLDNGLISGRASFETWELDGDAGITFDHTTTSVDHVYTFTVATFDNDRYIYDEKTFTLTVVNRDKQPYENLYIQILPKRAQRNYYDQLINNSDTFPEEYIYRASDPWYGKNTLRRSLFLAGLDPLQAADYINSMQLNHYWKTLNFGSIKTAQALDDNFNVKYEVVYVELLDRQVNDAGMGPPEAVNLPANSMNIATIYPNSFPNMAKRISQGIGYENRSVLPEWMTSRQPDGRVLGFTRALVLCYAQPGRSAEIAYRVNQLADTFKMIDFTIDRYEWDNILSANFAKPPAAGTGNITANTHSTTVTGMGTDFTHQLYPGKSLYVANVIIGNVKTVSNSTVLTLTANSISNVTSSSFTFSSNAFATSNFVNGSGNITANTQSNLVLGTNSTVIYAGTISGTISNATILGNGTSFATNLRVGDQLYYSGNLSSIGTIATIINATRLVLADPLNATISSISYASDGNNTKFLTELRVGDTLVVANAIIGTVQTITSNSNVTLTSNAYANVTSLAYQHTSRDPYTVPGQGNQYLKFPQVDVLA